MNFENLWGQKLVNALRAIHKFISSGEKINEEDFSQKTDVEMKDKTEWFISKRQQEFRKDDE